MAISFIGGSSVASTSITLPGSYQGGDLAVMYAFSTGGVSPTVPAGWTSRSTRAVTVGHTVAWKWLGSNSEVSGTWTSATQLICQIYRGCATDKVPLSAGTGFGASATTITYSTVAVTEYMSSWALAFGGSISDTSFNVAPANMTLECGAAVTTVAGSDTNGIITKSFAPTACTGSAAVAYQTWTGELYAEQPIGNFNNYQQFKVGNGMSMSEKIR